MVSVTDEANIVYKNTGTLGSGVLVTDEDEDDWWVCLLYTSPSPRD